MKTTVVVAVLALCGAALAAKLPPDFKSCSVKSADFSKCLTKAIQGAVIKLRDGEKTLGLPTIAPLHVDALTLDLGQGPISLVLDVKDLDVKGLELSEVKSAELNTKTKTLVVKAFTKGLRLDFQYKAKGKILVVAVQGDGPAFFEFDDIESTLTITAEEVEKKGKKYWKVNAFDVDISPNGMRCHFHELLKGNKAVSEQVNNVLNTEWKQFYQQIKKPAQEAFGEIFKAMAMRVFDRVPIGDIYLDL